MASQVNGSGQTAMDEIVIEDEELSAALEKRMRLADDKAEIGKSFKIAHEACVELLKGHDLEDGQALRVGRFRVSKRLVAGGPVSYSTSDRSQISFELVA